MKYIIESGSVRFVYSTLDTMSEELQKIFMFLIFFRDIELTREGYTYRVER